MGALPGEHAQRHALGFIRDLEGVESPAAFFGSCFSNFGAPAPLIHFAVELAHLGGELVELAALPRSLGTLLSARCD